MRELHVVALSEDGRSVLLATSRSAKSGGFRVALDDRLAAALRGDLARVGEARPRDSAVSPKEIQARLRAGESAEQIAADAGVAVGRVERFSGPVLSERARVIDEVRAAYLVRGRRGPSALPLGEAVDERLATLAREDSIRWGARREVEGGLWFIEVSYFSRGRTRYGRWRWDRENKLVRAVDTASIDLGHIEKAPAKPAKRPALVVSDAAPALLVEPTARKPVKKVAAKAPAAARGTAVAAEAVVKAAPAKKVAVRKGPVAKGAVAKGAVAKGAMAKGAVAKGAVAKGAAAATAQKAGPAKAPAAKASAAEVPTAKAPAAKAPQAAAAKPAAGKALAKTVAAKATAATRAPAGGQAVQAPDETATAQASSEQSTVGPFEPQPAAATPPGTGLPRKQALLKKAAETRTTPRTGGQDDPAVPEVAPAQALPPRPERPAGPLLRVVPTPAGGGIAEPPATAPRPAARGRASVPAWADVLLGTTATRAPAEDPDAQPDRPPTDSPG